jgi:methionyl-tRNA formyltransferase
LLAHHFDALLKGDAPRIPQDEAAASYTCARTPDDGAIDWKSTSATVHNLVRGTTHPYPGAIAYYRGERYRIWSGQIVNPARSYIGRIPGRIVSVVAQQGVEVLTGDGIYQIRTASKEGNPVQPAEELFRSIRTGFVTLPS